MAPKWLITAAVGVVALAAGAMAGERLVSPPPPAPSAPPRPTGAPSPPPRPAAPRGFVEFRDRKAGFSIAYPAGWRRLKPKDGTVRLIASAKDGSASVLVRAGALASRLPPGKLPAREGLTQQVLASGREVKLVAEPRQARLGGLPGFLYLYTFKPGRGEGMAVHSHYFLFTQDTRFTLVLEAVPADPANLRRMAPVLDRVAGTFRFRGATR